MPSTYSPDLRIELIANGEQSGSWGATTNTNLGTLIEDAISGLASVSVVSANQALTALNGIADQARCAAISLSTVTSANFNVYVPPVTKLYVVNNSSLYTATVYCSTVLGNTTAAGTGVSIPAGKSVLLRSDGVDIVEQVNHIQGNLTVGGNLAISGSTTLSADPTLALQAATKQYVDSAAAGSSPSGALVMWPTATAPTGWLLCNGAAVSRATYAALFAVIGTTFGSGDGSTTFNLPDYRDRMPIGASTISSIGGTGGSKDAIVVSHTHTASVTDPGHNHRFRVFEGKNPAYQTPWGYPMSISNGGDRTVTGTYNTTQNDIVESSTTGISVSNSSTGSSGTNANLPPYLGINFIIKT